MLLRRYVTVKNWWRQSGAPMGARASGPFGPWLRRHWVHDTGKRILVILSKKRTHFTNGDDRM